MDHLSDERSASFPSGLSSLNFTSGVLLVSHGDIYCSFFPYWKDYPGLENLSKILAYMH